MKRKKIKEILVKIMERIDELSSSIGNGFDKETIHDFRLAVKSLRSFLRLMESYRANTTFKVPKRIRRLYHIAGVIRESELEKEFLVKMHANIPQYIDCLDDTINQNKGEWEKCYSRKSIRRASKKITTYKYKKLNIAALRDFRSTCMKSIVSLTNSASDVQLHEVRKNVKDILHIARLIDKDLWASAHFLSEPAIGKWQELAQIIGRYNDERILLQHLDAFLPVVSDSNERDAIRQFEDIERKKLKLERRKIFDISRLATVTV